MEDMSAHHGSQHDARKEKLAERIRTTQSHDQTRFNHGECFENIVAFTSERVRNSNELVHRKKRILG